uniref:Uncharacterized protein n=1 Tax=Staphylococcus aureus TaxID=1280 RepID=A0A0C6EGL6_STAAU|nr:hypothetical protein [Staphylococcus aureus]
MISLGVLIHDLLSYKKFLISSISLCIVRGLVSSSNVSDCLLTDLFCSKRLYIVSIRNARSNMSPPLSYILQNRFVTISQSYVYLIKVVKNIFQLKMLL